MQNGKDQLSSTSKSFSFRLFVKRRIQSLVVHSTTRQTFYSTDSKSSELSVNCKCSELTVNESLPCPELSSLLTTGGFISQTFTLFRIEASRASRYSIYQSNFLKTNLCSCLTKVKFTFIYPGFVDRIQLRVLSYPYVMKQGNPKGLLIHKGKKRRTVT